MSLLEIVCPGCHQGAPSCQHKRLLPTHPPHHTPPPSQTTSNATAQLQRLHAAELHHTTVSFIHNPTAPLRQHSALDSSTAQSPADSSGIVQQQAVPTRQMPHHHMIPAHRTSSIAHRVSKRASAPVIPEASARAGAQDFRHDTRRTRPASASVVAACRADGRHVRAPSTFWKRTGIALDGSQERVSSGDSVAMAAARPPRSESRSTTANTTAGSTHSTEVYHEASSPGASVAAHGDTHAFVTTSQAVCTHSAQAPRSGFTATRPVGEKAAQNWQLRTFQQLRNFPAVSVSKARVNTQ
jgi:hypothetical protein